MVLFLSWFYFFLNISTKEIYDLFQFWPIYRYYRSKYRYHMMNFMTYNVVHEFCMLRLIGNVNDKPNRCRIIDRLCPINLSPVVPSSARCVAFCFVVFSPVLRIRIRRICVFLSLPDQDPYIIKQNKNSKKNIDSYFFVTSLWLSIFKNDVNVPLKSKKT